MISDLSPEWLVLIILKMFKLDRPFLNDWVEVAQRKVNGNELNS